MVNRLPTPPELYLSDVAWSLRCGGRFVERALLKASSHNFLIGHASALKGRHRHAYPSDVLSDAAFELVGARIGLSLSTSLSRRASSSLDAVLARFQFEFKSSC